MTETSRYWSDNTVGDGILSPYDDDEYSDIWRLLFQRDRTTQGPIEGVDSELLVTNPAGNTIRVPSGAALVDGKLYTNDANADNAIATPAVSTRIDRAILRKSWALQTVRVAILTGVEGGGVPSITQTDGVTWEIPLAQASITTGAAITLTDEREFSRTPLGPSEIEGLQLIETIAGDGASGTIDFSNIPLTFVHLFWIGNMRSAGAVVSANMDIRFNADGGANYDEQSLIGLDSTLSTNPNAGVTGIQIGSAPGASAVASKVAQAQGYISNYAQSSFFKTVLGQYINLPDGGTANYESGSFGGIWEDTSPISQVQFISGSGAWTTETSISLYGLVG